MTVFGELRPLSLCQIMAANVAFGATPRSITLGHQGIWPMKTLARIARAQPAEAPVRGFSNFRVVVNIDGAGCAEPAVFVSRATFTKQIILSLEAAMSPDTFRLDLQSVRRCLSQDIDCSAGARLGSG